jgi:hypothetical protein
MKETQNFDTGRRNHELLKLEGISRYDFELEMIFFSFFLVFKVHFLMKYDSMMSCNMSVLYIPHQKKRLAKYRWRTYSRWQNALIPVVSSNETIYAIVVSVPTEKHKIHIYTYITTYPQVAPTCLTLRGQRCICHENVFMSWGGDHKTSLGPHTLGARSWLVTWRTRYPYRTIGIVLNQTSSWGDGSGIHITRREDTYLLILS